jgi:hypothetical protein
MINPKIQKQKAAMFGLDARIALAIFAALSVISGAALYKVMENIKTSQYQAFFEGLAQAYEAYYIDNGEHIPISSGNYLESSDVLVNRRNLPTWRGPYTSAVVREEDHAFKFTDSAWGGYLFLRTTDWTPGSWCVVNSSECAIWVRFHANTEERQAWATDVFNKLDSQLDNGDGVNLGKVRYMNIDALNHYILYQIMPYVRKS